MVSFQHLPLVLSNFGVQLMRPNTKIFFIGFNKCATTSIHHMMVSSGIRSDHWERKKENLALEIASIVKDRGELRRYLRPATAYSDLGYFSDSLIIEGNKYFREYHETFPDAYFVLNDRDLEAWVRSRAGHRKGQLLERFMAFHQASADEVKDIWRQDHARHVEAVLKHFSGYGRFLRFYVDRDPPSRLTSFLAPTFRIDPASWQKVNATKVRTS